MDLNKIRKFRLDLQPVCSAESPARYRRFSEAIFPDPLRKLFSHPSPPPPRARSYPCLLGLAVEKTNPFWGCCGSLNTGGVALVVVLWIASCKYRQYKKGRRPQDFRAAFARLIKIGAISPDVDEKQELPRELKRSDITLLEQVGSGR
jgi:hypothetical protein